MASYVKTVASPCLWHRIDADDGDPATLFARLTAVALAEIGAAAKGLPVFASGPAASAHAFARAFFHALFATAPTLTLVLDDYQYAPSDSPLHELLCIAIEQVPEGAHIAVASRSALPLALARYQAYGMIGSISWDQLMLTPDEAIGFAYTLGVELERAAAFELHTQCGGWAAGLHLLLRSHQAHQQSSGRGREKDSRALLLQYFDQEVFQDLSLPTQSDLLRLAYLPRIPARLAIDLTESPEAERRLSALVAGNLFTAVTEEDQRTYSLNPLFRDFLIHRAEGGLAADEVSARRHRAAAALLDGGMIEDAVEVFADARAWDRLGNLVRAQAPLLMAQGGQSTVVRWMSRMPDVVVAADPWLLYWLGTCRSLGDPSAGRSSLEAAFDLFTRRQERAGILLAWAGVVDCIFRVYANLRQLDPWIARLEALLTADASFPSPEVEARVTFSMFVALSFHQPHHPGLAMWRQRLDAMTAAVPDPRYRLFARFHLAMDRIWQGDLHAARAEVDELRREIAHGPPSPLAELVGKFATSTHALYVGERVTCATAIEEALALSESSGVRVWDKILLGQGAVLALSHGDLARGQSFAQRRAAIAKPADDEERSLGHVIDAWSCWLGGNKAEALAHVRLAAKSTEAMGLPHFNAVGLLGLATVGFECGDAAAALDHVAAARALGAQTRNPMLAWMADLLEAYMRLQRGEDARTWIESAMRTGREHGFRHFFFWPRAAVAVVCLEALVLEIEVAYATDLIRDGSLAPPANALASDRWPWPVRVSTLGSFRVSVRGKPLSFSGKVQRAPLNLLKALIAFGGQKVSETRLIDALWPDSEGGAGAQALATTLFRLRKIVGGEAIARQGGLLSIVETECWIDCVALERGLKAELGGASLVEQVRRLYRGPFLENEDDAPWALALRERLHMAVVKKLSVTAAAALANGQVADARQIFEAGLEIDDLVEEFYRGLMQCQIAAGQPGLAVTTYRLCFRSLAQRLGVEPSAATRRLHLAAAEAAVE